MENMQVIDGFWVPNGITLEEATKGRDDRRERIAQRNRY